MIIVEFQGGLGNQLFQFAMCKYLQDKFSEDIYCDVTRFTHDSREYRDNELGSFAIPDNWHLIEGNISKLRIYGIRYLIWMFFTLIYHQTWRFFEKIGKRKWYGRLYQKMINLFGVYCVMDYYEDYYEPKRSFWKRKIFLGNWLWPDMVEKQGIDLCNLMQVKTMLSKSNKLFLDQINSTNSVAVHIRRGDYVTLGLVVCSINYYKFCIEEMAKMVDNPVFFVFSDDIEWCKDNLITDYKLVFVDNNNSSPEDMRLMYSCKHFIMSSSTFSWWGAYLGAFPQKKIIVPRYWNHTHNRVNPLVRNYMISVDNKRI